jgi:hypothetical protein
MGKRLLTALAVAGMLAGCATYRVNKDPGPRDTGIRYYRPKPYLLITHADPTGRTIKLKLEYLPDFNEEYSIKTRFRKTKVALKDGWNLIGVNQDAPPPEEPKEVVAGSPDLPPVVPAATNVPIGYYESVIEIQPNGRKVFRGWRYIGFSVLSGVQGNYDPNLPICGSQSCPMHGPDGQPCRPGEMQEPLFGLVSINGVMTFRQINEIAFNQGCPFYVETPKPTPPPAPPVEKVEQPPQLEGGAGATGQPTGGAGATSGAPRNGGSQNPTPPTPNPNLP